MNPGLSPPPDNRRNLTSATPPTTGPVLTQRERCLHLLGRFFLRDPPGSVPSDPRSSRGSSLRTSPPSRSRGSWHARVPGARRSGAAVCRKNADSKARRCGLPFARELCLAWMESAAWVPCRRCAVQRWSPVVPTAPRSCGGDLTSPGRGSCTGRGCRAAPLRIGGRGSGQWGFSRGATGPFWPLPRGLHRSGSGRLTCMNSQCTNPQP